MKERQDLTAERLRQLLHYDPETGVFTRPVRVSNCRIGKQAGCLRPDGYRYIGIDGDRYMAHRLAWLYATGQWPAVQIDHINGDRADNRFVNLREATNAENQRNSKRRSDNTSGFKGVHWRRHTGKWLAQIGHNGRLVYLGLFPTAKMAHAAYCEAARRLHGQFAKVGNST